MPLMQKQISSLTLLFTAAIVSAVAFSLPRRLSAAEAPAGKPWHQVCKNFDSWENGLRQNEVVGNKAMDYLAKDKRKRFLYFVH